MIEPRLNFTPPRRKKETSNFRGIVPIQSLISVKLSLKWALDEVSTINLTFPCVMEVLTILTILIAENFVTLFCFSTKFKIFKKFCLDIPKYTLKNC